MIKSKSVKMSLKERFKLGDRLSESDLEGEGIPKGRSFKCEGHVSFGIKLACGSVQKCFVSGSQCAWWYIIDY